LVFQAALGLLSTRPRSAARFFAMLLPDLRPSEMLAATAPFAKFTPGILAVG